MINNTIKIGSLLILSANALATQESVNSTNDINSPVITAGSNNATQSSATAGKFDGDLALNKRNILEEMVVTGTREERLKKETAESIVAFSEKDIENISPSHPAELLNRVAGVHINNLGGEGHMTSIRQPISTGPDYLFLEDGIPTRPTGFFNHNGLYEINIPQSSQVEVIKGPGSALYGSGAFGGIINSLTKKSPEEKEVKFDLEVGEHGWSRLLVGGGSPIGEKHGFRVDVNVTDNEGYRDYSEYSRNSLNFRLDNEISDSLSVKTVLAYTEVDQSGASSLSEDEYKNEPTKNIFRGDIGYRQVEALRLSSEFNQIVGKNGLTTATVYYRDNAMKMMPSWMVTYDPNTRDYQFESYGLMVKHRQNILDGVGKIIVGIDADTTPSQYKEHAITILPEQAPWLPRDYYEEYAVGELNYDFDAEQTSVSPFIHTEWKFGEKWLMNAGLRYDSFETKYENNLEPEVSDEAAHKRPESQSISYEELSPKLSLIYEITNKHMGYVNYRHAFTSPSVGSLFRPGRSTDSVDLKPTQADSYELGFRGIVNDYLTYEVAYYEMEKKDAVVSYVENGTRYVTNAGESSHKGLELALLGQLSDQFSYNFAWTTREQKYEEYQYIYSCFGGSCGDRLTETRNFAGNSLGKAPEEMGSLSLVFEPEFLSGTRLELETEHVGSYFTDESNDNTYEGHTLYNLRASYDFTDDITLQLRLINLTDETYSTYTSNQVNDLENLDYRPGLPRTGYISLKAKF